MKEKKPGQGKYPFPGFSVRSIMLQKRAFRHEILGLKREVISGID
jgi:hypothetical protein